MSAEYIAKLERGLTGVGSGSRAEVSKSLFFFFFAGHDVSLLHILSYYSRKTKVLLFSSLKCEN